MADKYIKCFLDECNGNAHWTGGGRKGLCSSHRQRLKTHGDPRGGSTLNGKPLDFVREAVKYAKDECLLWPYGTKSGYGQIRWNDRNMSAHRVVLILFTGDDPTDMVAAHKPVVCHNRLCVNPAHLRWAAHRDNAADRITDGTNLYGEKNSQNKLREADVHEIRRRIANGEPQESIARYFGVAQSLVSLINRGKRWAHI